MRLLTFFIFICLAQAGHADVYYRFVNYNCLPDVGYFEVIATGINNIDEFGSEKTVTGYIEKNSSLISAQSAIERKCAIGKDVFTISIQYEKEQATGACMGSPGGYIKIMENDLVLLPETPFHWSCPAFGYDLNQVKYNNVSLSICGEDYHSENSHWCLTSFNGISKLQIEKRLEANRKRKQ